MNTEEIKREYKRLQNQLHYAILTFERKDEIAKIRNKIIELQNKCSHPIYEFNEDGEEECTCCGWKRSN